MILELIQMDNVEQLSLMLNENSFWLTPTVLRQSIECPIVYIKNSLDEVLAVAIYIIEKDEIHILAIESNEKYKNRGYAKLLLQKIMKITNKNKFFGEILEREEANSFWKSINNQFSCVYFCEYRSFSFVIND